MKKYRADVYLTENGYTETRSQAQKLIMAGKVLCNEVPVDKPSFMIGQEDEVRVKETLKYVSRGALKLEKAIKTFKFKVKGKSFIDFGASTGGFTDILLQNGAVHVDCVDVGYGQLAWKIRNDDRVSVYERTNARYLTPDIIGGKKDAAVCDVSFISVEKILPAMDVCTTDEGEIVILIKPQFEAGKDKVGKKGVVKSPETHSEVIKKVSDFISCNTSFKPSALSFSPITGQQGNIEYLLYAGKKLICAVDGADIDRVISEAFSSL